ncbi:ATP-binding region ATPase domain protein [Methyloversatilis universalis FAM5]|uniref:ATP-binding region ATPase domain protein n=1 Tax=Methyloversatilis universalis (strain ATCC BAA-1314 / DSM 25237 / JCM 13912 / CCUG 52030 / FAM5) TaxID=1000565 RepID=F5R7M2_METUF|nr:HAMP domain-containing histidine kinase [Methyloversatilis universalis]EGK73476.1 ATP-binding region ATPase domain protein [Methyloversatilis universalis FAM5]
MNVPITSARLTRLLNWLSAVRPWLLLAVLASLHALLWVGEDVSFGRVLLLVHVGLLLMWQPLVGAQSRVEARGLAALAVVVLALLVFYGPRVLSLWMLLLAGLIGGKVFYSTSRGPRVYYLGALAYLITALFTVALPRALPPGLSVPAGIDPLGLWLSPLALTVMLGVSGHERADRDRDVLDFVSGLFVLLLLAVLALGTLAAMLLSGVDYLRALLGTLGVLAAMLLLLSWAWNPRGGFGGLGVAFTRYVLSLALPYERWLESLAALSERDGRPEDFVARAANRLLALPLVAGGEWRTRGGDGPTHEGHFGERGTQRYEFEHPLLALALYTERPLSGGLVWHFNLLVQLLGQFYQARLRAEELRRLSYLSAIHDTGARLTHDVKNLLQSLNTLCYALQEADGPEDAARANALLSRQLPVITARLEATLDKLRRPTPADGEWMPAPEWLLAMSARFAGQGVAVEGATDPDQWLPGALYTAVAENLIANALQKRLTEPDIAIVLRLGGERLSVEDDGSPVPPELEARLLREPVASATGLGVGLYQSARLAEAAGYLLALDLNRVGCVRFALVPAAASARRSDAQH